MFNVTRCCYIFPLAILCFIVAAGTGSLKAQELFLSANFIDETGGNGETWTEARQDIIFQAISDWTTYLSVDETVTFDLTFEAAGTGAYLGVWQGGYSVATGTDIRPWTDGVTHTISFNSSLMDTEGSNYLWFGGEDEPVPPNAWDGLTVARHEIGHMLGFADGFFLNQVGTGVESDPWVAQVDGSDRFDPEGLNVPMHSGDFAHTANAGVMTADLMNASLPNGDRRDVELIHAQMFGTAYPEYSVVPEPAFAALALSLLALVYATGRRRIQPARDGA